MSHADDVFVKNFLAVLGALVVFTILAFILARAIGSASMEKVYGSPKAVEARIRPVGKVRIAGEEPPPVEPAMQTATAAPAAPVAAPAKTGAEVYQVACLACHATGVAGAPKTGDKGAWDTRLQQGVDMLVTNAIKGKNAMPAKGGNPTLSDNDVKNAVMYILTETGLSPG